MTFSVRHALGSRRRVLLWTLGALVLLDIGRSLYAHWGYAKPTAVWQPNPSTYADIAWPPGSDLPANASRGAALYARHCAVCHGPDGRGNGPAAPSLIPHPRDFTTGHFKYKSTSSGELPLDSDLLRTVSRGLGASAMPYFGDLLTTDELLEVVRYVKKFYAPLDDRPVSALTIPKRVAATAASVENGKSLYRTLGCAGCHAEDGRGGLWLQDEKRYALISRDLTAPWTFRGGSEPEELWLRLTTGLAGTPMPPYAPSASDDQRWDLVNYVLSLARKAPWESGGRLDGPAQQTDLTRRGAYLVHAEICGLCHTTINRTGIYRGDDYYLAGGMRVGIYPHAMLVSPNLTSDSVTGLGRWSEAEVVEALRNGRANGRVLNVFDMPWGYLHGLTDLDATAIARYLKTLPPVHNQIPEPLRYGVIETLVAKIGRPLPALPPTVLTYADQQFGQPQGPSRDLPQTGLIAAQWAALIVGVIGFFLAPPANPMVRPRGARIVLPLIGIGLAGALAFVLYQLPLLRAIPPAQMVAGVATGIPDPSLTALSPEQQGLVKRGRYLFAVGGCALCHTNSGRGGLKVDWKPMGTLWTRNITPDPETGIGKWSDQEISRAIRSGVSRNGYQLHWQGMTWDHASNWDEEDIRALIAYLRSMPPIANRISPDRAPAADDCDTYTFWISETREAGCRD